MKKILSILMVGAMLASSTAVSADVTVKIDNYPVYFDVQPQIISDRILVPFRGIFEAMKANVVWDDATRTVYAQRNNMQVVLKIGNPIITVNNAPIKIDVAPVIIGNRTFIPLRAISDAFNMQVEWNPSTETAHISTKTDKSAETEVLAMVNQYRMEAGIEPLIWDDNLAAVAENHCKDMIARNFFDHENPDGNSPYMRMRNYGISFGAAAENIAAGQRTPAEVMKSWMNSPGHRENIMNPLLKKIGIGRAVGGEYGMYWTQCFTD